MIKIQNHIKIVLVKKNPKTNIYLVYNKINDNGLGFIKWYGGFRKYCFFPFPNTLFESKCLNEIEKFMDELMKKRK